MERGPHKIDIEAIRNELATELIRNACKVGAKSVVEQDITWRIAGGKVVTCIDGTNGKKGAPRPRRKEINDV